LGSERTLTGVAAAVCGARRSWIGMPGKDVICVSIGGFGGALWGGLAIVGYPESSCRRDILWGWRVR